MAKDPAFLWYWGDWSGGTSTFNRQMKGCYMDLLNAQFNNGPLSHDEIKTILGSDFGLWPAIQKKFEKGENGLFFNKRMEFEKAKRRAYSESRRKNLHMDSHMPVHMENENEDENVNKEKKEDVPRETLDFLTEIRKNKAYAHVNIDQELLRMDAWLLTRPGRKKTKRFVVNWLNKVEAPLGAHKAAVKIAKPNADCTACGGTGELPDKKRCWCWK